LKAIVDFPPNEGYDVGQKKSLEKTSISYRHSDCFYINGKEYIGSIWPHPLFLKEGINKLKIEVPFYCFSPFQHKEKVNSAFQQDQKFNFGPYVLKISLESVKTEDGVISFLYRETQNGVGYYNAYPSIEIETDQYQDQDLVY